MNFKINILKYVNPPVFFVSLVIGLVAVYLTVPENRIIYVYPTPENVATLQYKDKTGNCFSMKQKEVTCPKNDSEISKLPAQA
jgi:hypothetical protein